MRTSAHRIITGVLTIALAAVGATKAAGRPEVLQLYSYELKDKLQFEDGYRRHLGWHAAHGDTLVWYGWMVDSGPRKGMFVDGTAGASYAALDGRPDPAGDGADAIRNFVPFVRAANVETWELWREPSSGTPLESRIPGAVMDVFVMHVAPGAAARFERDVVALNAKRSGNASMLTWYRGVRGGRLPTYMLVLSRSGWSELEHAGGMVPEMLGRNYIGAPARIAAILDDLLDVEVESWSYQPRLSLIPGQKPAS